MKYLFQQQKVLLLAFMLAAIFTSSNSKAQGGMTATDQDVVMTVRLNEAIGIEVLVTSSLLEFLSASDYQNGVTITELSALRITSSRGYELKVRSRDASLTHTSGSTIDIGNLKVETTTSLTSNNIVTLSTIDQTFATGNAVIQKEIDIKYTTNPNNSAFIGNPDGDYTVALIYSVVTI